MESLGNWSKNARLGSTIAEVPTKTLVDASGALCTLGYATLAYLARQTGEPGLLASRAWTASVAILMSYITGLNLNDYSLQAFWQPWWARPVEFGAIGLALFYDLRSRRSAARGTLGKT